MEVSRSVWGPLWGRHGEDVWQRAQRLEHPHARQRIRRRRPCGMRFGCRLAGHIRSRARPRWTPASQVNGSRRKRACTTTGTAATIQRSAATPNLIRSASSMGRVFMGMVEVRRTGSWIGMVGRQRYQSRSALQIQLLSQLARSRRSLFIFVRNLSFQYSRMKKGMTQLLHPRPLNSKRPSIGRRQTLGRLTKHHGLEITKRSKRRSKLVLGTMFE